MRTASLLFVSITLALLGACGNNGSGTPSADLTSASIQDMAKPRSLSCCGMPGDPGNAVGVGKYCTKIDDCGGNTKATICATLGGDDRQTFCTFPCTPSAGMDPCGAGAMCACQAGGGNCGCVPMACLANAPDGCM